jgi:hypothetical protein
MERQRRLEKIQQQISEAASAAENDVWYYWTWCEALQFVLCSRDVALAKLLEKDRVMAHVFPRVVFLVEKFKRSNTEGEALVAKLLEWTVAKYTAHFHSALHDEEFARPGLIYGTDRATDELPIPD